MHPPSVIVLVVELVVEVGVEVLVVAEVEEEVVGMWTSLPLGTMSSRVHHN